MAQVQDYGAVRRSCDMKPLRELLPLDTPLSLMVDPSNGCNFRCVFCPAGDAHRGRFERIETTTNGALLTADRAAEIIAAGIDGIRTSVYGLDDGSYKQNAGVEFNFETIVQNVTTLFSLKSAKRPELHVHCKTIDTGLSQADKQTFIDMFSPIADSVLADASKYFNRGALFSGPQPVARRLDIRKSAACRGRPPPLTYCTFGLTPIGRCPPASPSRPQRPSLNSKSSQLAVTWGCSFVRLAVHNWSTPSWS